MFYKSSTYHFLCGAVVMSCRLYDHCLESEWASSAAVSATQHDLFSVRSVTATLMICLYDSLMSMLCLSLSLCAPLYSVPSLVLNFLHPQGGNLLSEHLLTYSKLCLHICTCMYSTSPTSLNCNPLKRPPFSWVMPADKIMRDESLIKCVWVILSYRAVRRRPDVRLHTLMEKFMTSLMGLRLTPPFIPFQLPPLYAFNV